MKAFKLMIAALVAALCVGTASAQYQQIPPQVIGPVNATSVLCNPAASAAFTTNCALGGGLQVTAGGVVSSTGTGTDTGTTFTLSGGTGSCATTGTLVGGATRGTFICTGTAGAGTVLVTMGAGTPAAAHGWQCFVSDTTTPSVGETKASGGTTSAATLAFTTAVNTDVIGFACFAY
jgi:hypothetical protein